MIKLAVPYRSQWGNEAKYSLNDCGAACLAMVIAYCTGKYVRVDEIAEYLKKKGTIKIDELEKAAAKYGLTTKSDIAYSLADMEKLLAEEKPLIALIKYANIADRYKMDEKYKDGHFVVIVGIDSDFVVYHDPDFIGTDGAYIRVPKYEFMAAFRANGQYKGILIVPAYEKKQVDNNILNKDKEMTEEQIKEMLANLAEIRKALWCMARGEALISFKKLESPMCYRDKQCKDAIRNEQEFEEEGRAWQDIQLV
jgi:predicted double-glycine peptidase